MRVNSAVHGEYEFEERGVEYESARVIVREGSWDVRVQCVVRG